MNSTGKWIICWRAGLRPLFRNPRASFLSVASIALGVAVFLAITIANRGAMESFHEAFAEITGRADLEIWGDLPEALFLKVSHCQGVAAATPLIEGMVTLPDYPGESLHLVGIDPFTATGVLTMDPGIEALRTGSTKGGLDEWLKGEDLAVSPDFLRRHRLNLGETIRAMGPGAPRRIRIGFEMHDPTTSTATDGRVAAVDIAAAQEWIGTPGHLTAILLRLNDRSQQETVITRLRKLLPETVTIEPPARRTRQVDAMLSSFRMNLSALSLISLMVGMFFVGNAAAAAVIRTRVSLGILRAMGVGRRMILGMVLGVSLFWGVVGGLLGVAMAPILASILAAPIAQTVTALYLPVEPSIRLPTFWEGVAGVVAGVGASVLAAWFPARLASGVNPVQVLHPGTAPEVFPMPTGWLAMAGIVAMAATPLFSIGALHGGSPLLGFVAAFLVLVGFSLCVPWITAQMARAGSRFFPGGPICRLALEQSLRSMYRTAPTIAALAAAVSMMVGISVMIHSFRGSVVAWVGRTLAADLFIAPASNELIGPVHTLPQGAARWWETRPGVRAVGTFREFEARTGQAAAVTLGVIGNPARGAIDFLHGDGEKKTKALVKGEGVAVSESLARRLHIGPGGSLTIVTPVGTHTLQVIDIYRDYTRDRGIAMIGADLFRRLWGEQGVQSLSVEFTPGTTQREMDQERSRFMDVFGGREAFACYSNRMLKGRILEIFNQTFAVTGVLRTISIAVAIGGVMLTLGMIVLEQTRDIGVLRAMGASARQIIQMMMAEAALIGMIASVVGVFSGSALGVVLTWVINKAFFGWSIDLSYPLWELMSVPCWMTVAALLAGAAPAIRAAAISPAAALRME